MRKVYRLEVVPSADRYADALAAVRIRALQKRILLLHRASEALRTTPSGLAMRLDPPRHFGSVNLNYGTLGAAVGGTLGLRFAEAGGEPLRTTALAAGWRQGPGVWVWEMYGEVAEAIDRLWPDWRMEI